MAWNEDVRKYLKDSSNVYGGIREGNLYTASWAYLGVTAGTSKYTAFSTGDKPVLMYARTVYHSGKQMVMSIGRGSFTGGTNISIIANANDISTNTTSVSLKTDVTSGSLTAVSALYYVYNSEPLTMSTPLLMRPNTNYVFITAPLGADATQDFTVNIAWYEGAF